MIWAHETSAITLLSSPYYGRVRPVKMANVNIQGMNWAVLAASICTAGLPFLGTAKIRNILDRILQTNITIWNKNVESVVKAETLNKLQKRKKLTLREERCKKVLQNIKENVACEA